jgi:hypothetical protein
MEMMAYGYIKPEFSVKMVKQVTAFPEVIAAAEALLNHYDETSFRGWADVNDSIIEPLRSALLKANGGE